MLPAPLWRSLAPRLSAIGFKILVDLLASSPVPLRIREIPYVFRSREFGESKLDAGVAWDFLMLLWEKRFGRFLSARFMSFALVGTAGVVVHFSVLFPLLVGGVGFNAAHAVATLLAMTSNFLLNDALTYRDRRLRGAKALAIGWASFIAAGSLSAAANVGVASVIHTREVDWALSAIAGIAVGTAWNFLVTRTVTWRA